MPEADLISQQYESIVKSVFNSFFINLTEVAVAADPKAATEKAELSFRTGISIAKDARDRALKLVA